MTDEKAIIITQDVKIEAVEEKLSGELAEKIFYECDFCGKRTGYYPDIRKLCEKISGENSFYCPFCLRHGFNTKSNRHVLMLTFRSIIGYYYLNYYRHSTKREMWISEIEDCINSHIVTGLQNPVFSYDPESYVWFIDFKHVGKGQKKIQLNEVLKTIVSITACFNLPEKLTSFDMPKFYEKFREAVCKFYTHRYRPDKRRLLAPTLQGCGTWDNGKKFTFEDTRWFEPKDLIKRF